MEKLSGGTASGPHRSATLSPPRVSAAPLGPKNQKNGAHDRNRTGEPLPYQGSALPTELRGRDNTVRKRRDGAYRSLRTTWRHVKAGAKGGWSGRRDSNSRHPAWKAGALPTELLPLRSSQAAPSGISPHLCEVNPPASAPANGRNSEKPRSFRRFRPKRGEICYIQLFRSKVVVGGGFEPPKALPTDLQSVPFDRSGTPPCIHQPNRFAGIWQRWSQRQESNPRPADYKSAALPTELLWPGWLASCLNSKKHGQPRTDPCRTESVSLNPIFQKSKEKNSS